jgi:hypothetical protein
MSQSVVASRYPHLVPGLCGRLECPRVCSRVCHCEAGLRRSRASLAEQARRRFAVRANGRQEEVCSRIRKDRLCPRICQRVGGCFLPRDGDHPSEVRRKVFRCQHAVDLLLSVGGLR